MSELTDADKAILRAAVAAMPHTNPGVADDLIGGFTMHTEAEDIIAIWRAAAQAAQPEPMSAPTAEPVHIEREAFDEWFRGEKGLDHRADTTGMDAAWLPWRAWKARAFATPPSAATPEPSDAEPTEAQIDAYCEAWGAAFDAENPDSFGVTVEPLSESLRRCIVAGLRAAIRATKGGKL